jgi:hypothetical protein
VRSEGTLEPPAWLNKQEKAEVLKLADIATWLEASDTFELAKYVTLETLFVKAKKRGNLADMLNTATASRMAAKALGLPATDRVKLAQPAPKTIDALEVFKQEFVG